MEAVSVLVILGWKERNGRNGSGKGDGTGGVGEGIYG